MSTPRSAVRRQVAVLGWITISVYGCWTYAFGVLLDPIVDDTGWSEVSVVSVYSVSGLLAGIGALAGGWILDRYGAGPVFALGAGLGSVCFLLASVTSSFLGFAILGAAAGGAFGSFGFYHVTQTVAARLAGDPVKSVTQVTIWGALAGTVYLPLAAELTDWFGWRTAMAVMGGSAGMFLALGAMVLPTSRATRDTPNRGSLRSILRSKETVWFSVAIASSGIAISVIVVYQVALMVAAGLGLGTASVIAGARSLAQLGGRLPLPFIVGRVGTLRAIELSFATLALSCLVVAFASTKVLGVLFAALAGYGVGSMSPLIGLHAMAIFPPEILGIGRAAVGTVATASSAIGPVLAAGVVAMTGSRVSTAMLAAGASIAAILSIRRAQSGDRARR